MSNVTDRLDFIHEYLTTDAKRVRRSSDSCGRCSRRCSSRSGSTRRQSDSDERRALRSTLIETLGTTGADPSSPPSARTALDRTLAGGPPLDPTLAGAIIAVAAEHGDRALQDALLAAADRATAPDEHYRYLYALARFRDPALIDRALEYSLTSKLRSQDTAGFLSRFLGAGRRPAPHLGVPEAALVGARSQGHDLRRRHRA